MKDTKKIYDKAITYFQQGKINKAMDNVELAISMDMKNSPALNLKAMLLYLKGDIEGAETAWKINKDFNDDTLAKSYLKDLEEDRARLVFYDQALNFMKEMKIDAALELLDKCRESDFNAINVYNALSFCYIKKGGYERANAYIDKVFSIDAENPIAKDNIKILREFGVAKKSGSKLKPIITSVMVMVLLSGGFLVYKYKIVNSNMVNKNSNVALENKEMSPSVAEKNTEKEVVKEEVKENEEPKEEKKVLFNEKELQQLINANDFDGVYNILKQNDKNKLDLNEKAIYEKGEQFIKARGVEVFYSKGSEYFTNKDFENANSQFLKAYDYVDNGYLRPHIIYFIGLSYEKKADNDNALKYYEQYVNENKNGDYTEEVLYKLANIYYNVNKEKAKTYAVKLNEEYTDSIYNNSTIRHIINSK